MSELNKKLQALSQKQGVTLSDLQPAIIKPLPRAVSWRWLGLGVLAMSLTGVIGWWLGSAASRTETAPVEPALSMTARSTASTEIPTQTAVATKPVDLPAKLPIASQSDAQSDSQIDLQTALPVEVAVTPKTASEAMDVAPPVLENVTEENATADKPAVKPSPVEQPVVKETALKVLSVDKPGVDKPSIDKRIVVKPIVEKPAAPSQPSVAEKPVKKTTEPEAEKTPTSPAGLTIETVDLDAAALAQLEYKKAEKALKQGDSRNAMTALEAALAYRPHWVLARQKLAALYYGRQDTRRAMAVLQQGLQLDSGQSELRVTLAKLLVNESQQQAALSVLNALPKDGNSRYLAMRGALAQQLHQPALALSSYQRLVADHPYDGRWWMGLGIALERSQASSTSTAHSTPITTEKVRHAYQQALLMGQISNQSQQFIQQRLAVLSSQKG
ncbi:tetratricopeptide repeat protein [Photobacterium japonica]|uniref:tetratricopeptide repeat protein n=1 Tax=Photobacterium japonica TaxID=2910235 RepID=UPI003D141312